MRYINSLAKASTKVEGKPAIVAAKSRVNSVRITRRPIKFLHFFQISPKSSHFGLSLP